MGGVSEQRRGLAFGAAAYLMWGLFPLYFPLLEPATPLEILANRIVWSFLVVALLLVLRRRWTWIGPLLRDRRKLLLLSCAAVAIALNWGTYIYGVNSEQVVETSLGYFINPLVSILFGVVLFKERLRRWQWVAVGLGGFAVVILTVDYGHPPWIALTLAFSFGTYGLLKKTVDANALEGLSVETAVLFLPAFGYLMYLVSQGTSAVQEEGLSSAAMLSTTGLVTAVPLLLFSAAATRIPLSWIGLMQYSTPVIQLMIGVFVYDEAMPPVQLVGFSLVWTALTILAIDSVAAVRRGRQVARDETCVDAAEAH